MFLPQNGTTPIWRAAERGHVEIVKYLKEAGADIEAKDKVSIH